MAPAYTIDFEVAKGAHGAVYAVKRRSDGASFACKKFVGIDEVRNMFAVRGINGVVNIVDVVPVMRYGNRMCMIMELCAGSMFDIGMKHGWRFTEAALARLFKQLAEGLTCVHAAGVVHRDIKPHNILYTYDGQAVKLADFGSSFTMKSSNYMTDLQGTVSYMAPEVATGKKYDQQVDIWSLGMTLYALLVGFHPFFQMTAEGMVNNLLQSSDPSGQLVYHQGISAEAKDLISKMTSYVPKDRPSAKELSEHPWVKNNARKEVTSSYLVPPEPYMADLFKLGYSCQKFNSRLVEAQLRKTRKKRPPADQWIDDRRQKRRKLK